jgi:hypothetical protein
MFIELTLNLNRPEGLELKAKEEEGGEMFFGVITESISLVAPYIISMYRILF